MKELRIKKNVLSRNEDTASGLRRVFAENGVLVLNLLSSPGSGKTTLLERTAETLGGKMKFAVIEGDLQTDRDAERIRQAGVDAVQINTHGGCHLDAAMIAQTIEDMDLAGLDVLFIENVGNLVCPAVFDLGEDLAVLLASVTEGDDKPGKYPTAFLKADVVVVNKMDLAAYTNFSLERFAEDTRRVKESLELIQVSCTQCTGLDRWFAWLEDKVAAKRSA